MLKEFKNLHSKSPEQFEIGYDTKVSSSISKRDQMKLKKKETF